MKSKYEKFSYVYKVMNYDFPYNLWLDIINKYNKNTSILDVGCGTGEILNRLVADKRVGIDNSATMIEIAESNAPNCEFYVQDMKYFELDESFDLIIATADVLNYVSNINELKTALLSVSNHMNENSVFIFDMHSEFKILNEFDGEIYMDDTPEITYIWEVSNGVEELSVIHDITYFIKDEDNKYDKYQETHYQQGFKHQTVVELLDELGFDVISTFSDFDPDNDVLDVCERNFFIIKLK
ncbi:class I SAM-dependent DNA methyltransferase [Phocicoccus pinnipedialis]|uniref:tRNA (Cmo5U34)-methyltransferase n=1 Tax=Phocicoccus pinnipedialis TaxID=110845 RepID=A0A6V7RGH4_9BACL|nr:class I SAM-dependent methyltransferase [Jeotgalicoccus pinnipedialis]MBP1939242.1 SAM-dependent methyltransferase [Jeotgalicoccus pinnipedialis]CAD2076167.1 tRNA (cmo5U34)-methyltransferase [Jeotgalicoccus pinnipedialis]